MKKELFTKYLTNRGARIILKNDPHFTEINERNIRKFKRLKGFFQYIDFHCQINDDGECKHQTSPQCCCFGCYDNAGFFRKMIDADITWYARRFYKTGFWRKGKGCILPHEMRSCTCLGHHCNHDKKDFSAGIRAIQTELYKVRDRI
jgi:hypothetical protein